MKLILGSLKHSGNEMNEKDKTKRIKMLKIPELKCSEEAYRWGASLEARNIWRLKKILIDEKVKLLKHYEHEHIPLQEKADRAFRLQMLREALIAATMEWWVLNEDGLHYSTLPKHAREAISKAIKNG